MDNDNNELGTFTRTVPADVTEITKELCPTFKNMSFFSSEEMGEENQYLIVYTRSSYNVMLRCVDERGAILAEIDNAVPVGERFTMYTPEIPHYTKESAEMADGVSYTPSSDFEFYVYYATNAYTGIKKLGRLVTKLNDERSYALSLFLYCPKVVCTSAPTTACATTTSVQQPTTYIPLLNR